MSMIETFLKEMKQEATTTRKMLERIPDDKYDWKPHEKSMSILQLSSHIAELPSWVSMALKTTELDFAAAPYDAPPINKTADVVALFEKSLEGGLDDLSKANEEQLDEEWTLRNGDHIISKMSKEEVIRMAFSQTIHHRAQLGVFLRLLDVSIPGSYGPSADEPGF